MTKGNKLKKLEEGKEVILISKASKKSVRIQDDGSVDGNGAEGPWARFKVVRTGPWTVKFNNVQNSKHWLRIDDHNKIDGHGVGGPRTEFKIEVVSKGHIRLQSTLPGGHYLAINHDGSPNNTHPPSHADHSIFKVKVPGRGGVYKQGTIVRFKSVATGQNLRIKQDGSVDGHGAEGQWATFILHRVGKNHIKLQNVGNKDHWLRIKDGKLDGEGVGGPWTELKVIKHGGHLVSLEAIKTPGQHVGILPDGTPKPPGATGTGPHGTFKVARVN